MNEIYFHVCNPEYIRNSVEEKDENAVFTNRLMS